MQTADVEIFSSTSIILMRHIQSMKLTPYHAGMTECDILHKIMAAKSLTNIDKNKQKTENATRWKNTTHQKTTHCKQAWFSRLLKLFGQKSRWTYSEATEPTRASLAPILFARTRKTVKINELTDSEREGDVDGNAVTQQLRPVVMFRFVLRFW